MGRGSIMVLAVSGMAACGALATGPGLASPAAAAAGRTGAAAAAAAAPVWGNAQALAGVAADRGESGSAFPTMLACSSPGNCAVGGNYAAGSGDTVSYSAFVADQRNGTWGAAIEVPGLAGLNAGANAGLSSLSCASAGNCTAGGSYSPGGADAGGVIPASEAFVVTEKDGTWGSAIEVPGTAALNTGGSAQVTSVSCWSPGDCTAAGEYSTGEVFFQETVDSQAFVVTEKNGTWGTASTLPGLAALNAGDWAYVSSVSCAAGGHCAVGGFYTTAGEEPASQAFVADESAGTWQAAEEVPGTGALNVYGDADVFSISCSSPGHCGAIGFVSGGFVNDFFASETNGTWRIVDAEPEGINANALSCPAAGNCAAGGGDSGGESDPLLNESQAITMDEKGGTWGQPQPVPGLARLNVGDYAAIESVSCSAPGDCAAGGIYTGVKTPADQAPTQGFVVTETDGTWGHAEEVPGISALTADGAAAVDGVSCASPEACTATGAYGTGGVFVVSTRLPTTTTESLSAAKVAYGHEQAERLSVAVTAKTNGRPAGTVTVSAGSLELCQITLRSGRGSCTLTARRLRPGTYRLTAAYPGSPGFTGSVSRAKTLTVAK